MSGRAFAPLWPLLRSLQVEYIKSLASGALLDSTHHTAFFTHSLPLATPTQINCKQHGTSSGWRQAPRGSQVRVSIALDLQCSISSLKFQLSVNANHNCLCTDGLPSRTQIRQLVKEGIEPRHVDLNDDRPTIYSVLSRRRISPK